MEPETTYILPIIADRSFTRAERKLIARAGDKWYRFTQGRILFQFSFDLSQFDIDAPREDDLLFRLSRKSARVSQFMRENSMTLSPYGLYQQQQQNGLIYLMDHCNEHFETTLMHELGHYLGLMHTAEPESIMHAYITDRRDFAEADAIEFLRVYGGELIDLDYADRSKVSTNRFQ